MKKMFFALLLVFACSTGFSQVYGPSQPIYNNGDSYGFWINPIPGAVSYEWSTMGLTNPIIYPAWDTAIDIIFMNTGMCDVICKVTMEDGSEREYAIQVIVDSERRK